MENRAKDDYISDLKAENYELRQRERNLFALNERVGDSEHRLRLVKDSRVRNILFSSFIPFLFRPNLQMR